MSERNKEYTWKGQLAVGASGEEVVKRWLEGRGYGVEDVSKIQGWQQDGVDLRVLRSGLRWFSAEVKTDTYDNNYIFFELYTAEHKPGALYKSRARVWYIYKPRLGLIVEVEPAAIATFIFRSERISRFQIYPVFNDKKKVRAWGVKLSLDDLTGIGGVLHYLSEEQDDTTDSQDPSTTEGGSE